jgi:hypothetical protein
LTCLTSPVNTILKAPEMDVCALRYTHVSDMFFRGVKHNSVVQDNAEERIVDVDLAVVSDIAQCFEFVHEEINSRSRRANHSN